jgi:hypothetical protein
MSTSADFEQGQAFPLSTSSAAPERSSPPPRNGDRLINSLSAIPVRRWYGTVKSAGTAPCPRAQAVTSIMLTEGTS